MAVRTPRGTPSAGRSRRGRPPLGQTGVSELPRIVLEGVTMVIATGLIISAVGLELDPPRVAATLGLFAYALIRLMPMATR